MSHGSHHPVIGSDDALVVVSEREATNLRKKAISSGGLAPSLVHTDTGCALMAPGAHVLDGGLHFQPAALIAERQAFAFKDESRLVISWRFVGVVRHAAIANLTARKQLNVCGEKCVLPPTAGWYQHE